MNFISHITTKTLETEYALAYVHQERLAFLAGYLLFAVYVQHEVMLDATQGMLASRQSMSLRRIRKYSDVVADNTPVPALYSTYRCSQQLLAGST